MNPHGYRCLVLVGLLAYVLTAGAARAQPQMYAHVVRVFNGSTFVVQHADKQETFRMYGLVSPSAHPFSRDAFDFSRRWLEGVHVGIEFAGEQRDSDGHRLAYVWLHEELFNESLLYYGLAQVAPDTTAGKYSARFAAAQSHARGNSLGLWGAAAPVVVRPQPPQDAAGEASEAVVPPARRDSPMASSDRRPGESSVTHFARIVGENSSDMAWGNRGYPLPIGSYPGWETALYATNHSPLGVRLYVANTRTGQFCRWTLDLLSTVSVFTDQRGYLHQGEMSDDRLPAFAYSTNSGRSTVWLIARPDTGACERLVE